MTIFEKEHEIHEKVFQCDSNPALLYTVWSPLKPNVFTHVYGKAAESTLENYDFAKPAPPPPPVPDVSAEPPPPMPAENICGHCGAISFFPVEVCGICKKKAAAPPPEKKPVKVAETKKKRSLTFIQFEETKVQMNKLRRRWERMEFIEPPPPERAELEAEIERLDKLLEDNIHLALLFQIGKFPNEKESYLQKWQGKVCYPEYSLSITKKRTGEAI
jgi:hypothetical protein